jgi:integrase
MAKRRTNREGSIVKRPSGRFQAQIQYEGKRLYKTFQTKKECVRWIRNLGDRFDNGLTGSNANQSLSNYLSLWLDWKRAEIKQKTWDQYSSLIARYVAPRLGAVKLLNLKPIHVQNLYSSLRKDEISPRKIQLTHSILHAALGMAQQLGQMGSNPAAAVKRPRVEAKEMKILNKFQAERFLTEAAYHRLYALFRLAILGGLRLGELLGLQWQDIDWASAEISVKRQSQRKHGGGTELHLPKTVKGVRRVPLGKESLKSLMKHFTWQTKHFGKEPLLEQRIFVSLMGQPIRSSGVQKTFKKLLERSGIAPIRFHDLRHTAASLMLMQGMSVLEVSRILGHSRASTTLDIYAHLVPGIKSDAIDQLDQMLKPNAAELLRNPVNNYQTLPYRSHKHSKAPEFPSKSV